MTRFASADYRSGFQVDEGGRAAFIQKVALTDANGTGLQSASGVTPVTGSFGATGQSASIATIAGRNINITVDGTFSAAIQVERSFSDSPTTWHIVFTDSMRSAVPPSFSLTESEAGVLYRLNCTAYTSGSAVYRLSI